VLITDRLGLYGADIHGRYWFYDELVPPFPRWETHFSNSIIVGLKLFRSVRDCNALGFLNAMHMMQDTFSHSGIGGPLGHAILNLLNMSPDKVITDEQISTYERMMTLTFSWEMKWIRKCAKLPVYYGTQIDQRY